MRSIHKPIPLSLITKKAMPLWIERMYNAGVITRVNLLVDCQSSCFVVPKKNEKERLVVDMRKVNEIFLEDDFAPALPTANIMAAMQDAGSSVFSSQLLLQSCEFRPRMK